MRAAGPAVSLRAEVQPADLRWPYRIRNPERTANCRCEKTRRAPGRSPLSRASPRWEKFGLSHNQKSLPRRRPSSTRLHQSLAWRSEPEIISRCKGVQVALLFLFFHKRLCGPLATPVAILAMTSETLTRGQIYDAASKVVQQALSRIEGVGQVQIGGSSLPAVRIELNPPALFKYGIGLEDVRAALASG
jgi:hypothetical protein